MDQSAEDRAYEEQHVHQVYERISSHFSSTRYKPWPVVDEFLRGLPPGSVGLDVGCGNGKYLSVNNDVFIVASDRSEALVQIARQHTRQSAIVADALNPPHPGSRFDFAISVAVIHHLSTMARRIAAIRCILDSLRPKDSAHKGGEALIFVWALEQKGSRRGWAAGDEQDVLVPWILKEQKGEKAIAAQDRTFYRYYHLYEEGELERDIMAAGGLIQRSGFDRDNWWAVAKRGK